MRMGTMDENDSHSLLQAGGPLVTGYTGWCLFYYSDMWRRNRDNMAAFAGWDEQQAYEELMYWDNLIRQGHRLLPHDFDRWHSTTDHWKHTEHNFLFSCCCHMQLFVMFSTPSDWHQCNSTSVLVIRIYILCWKALYVYQLICCLWLIYLLRSIILQILSTWNLDMTCKQHTLTWKSGHFYVCRWRYEELRYWYDCLCYEEQLRNYHNYISAVEEMDYQRHHEVVVTPFVSK